jgi:hypothetical protein
MSSDRGQEAGRSALLLALPGLAVWEVQDTLYHESAESRLIHYTDCVTIPGRGLRLKVVVVIVNPDRKPQEVVTWIPKKNASEEDLSGGVLYDASRP